MTTATDSKGLCPICRKPMVQQFRPFCSRRCGDIDLGRWFSESYAIPVPPDPDDAETLQSDEDDR